MTESARPWWFELFFGTTRGRTITICVLVAIVVLFSSTVVILLKKDLLRDIPYINPRAFQRKSGRVPAILATFGSGWPATNNGLEWGVFNDNKYLGRSTAWFETAANPDLGGDYFLRMHYTILRGQRSQIGEGYCGMFTDLRPPLGTVDLTGFAALRFRARRSPAAPAGLRYLVSLANPQIPRYGYHEFDFSQLLRVDGAFTEVRVPFTLLRQPDWWTEEKQRFDPEEVQRLSFVVKGSDGDGYLDIDDIGFLDGASAAQ